MRKFYQVFLIIAGIGFLGIVGFVKPIFFENISLFSVNVFSATGDTTSQLIAKAYIQAVTNGSGSKIVPGIVDYTTCNSSKQWDDTCQKVVYNGKDGKTIFMESLSGGNILDLMPVDRAIGSMGLDLFTYLTNCPTKYYTAGCGWTSNTGENGWYSYITNNKKILRDYLIVTAKNDINRITVARAYIQAVTNGSGSKIVPGIVDYTTCNSSKQWDDACQQIIYGGLDGKSLFMEAITVANIATILPKENARIATGLDIFKYLTGTGNGWYMELDSQKTVLLNYLIGVLWGPKSSTMAPGLFTYFDAIGTSNVTKMTVEVVIKNFPKDFVPSDILYFWALTVNFSNVPGIDMEYWGHIGLQYASSCGSLESKCANWGGGGNLSDGTYGTGGGIVKGYPWKINNSYTYMIERGAKNSNNTWNWNGKITDKSTGFVTDMGNVLGGEYIVTDGFKDRLRSTGSTIDCSLPINRKNNLCKDNPYVMTETGYGVICDSPSAIVEWFNPVVNLFQPPMLVTKSAICTNTSQKILSNNTVNIKWTHETNSVPGVEETLYRKVIIAD